MEYQGSFVGGGSSPPPGAPTSSFTPKFEKGARTSACVKAATVIAFGSDAGKNEMVSSASLPAAATKTTPAACATAIASAIVCELPPPPQLALTTSAPLSTA
jgi:hypothetical protein